MPWIASVEVSDNRHTVREGSLVHEPDEPTFGLEQWATVPVANSPDRLHIS